MGNDADSQIALWVNVVVMGFFSLLFARASYNSRSHSSVVYHYLTLSVTMVAFSAYLCKALGIFEGKGIVYLDWAIATPMLLLDLCMLAGCRVTTAVFAAALDVFMVALGYAAEVATTDAQRWVAYLFSCLFFVAIFVIMLGAMRTLVKEQPTSIEAKTLKFLSIYTTVIWCAYPIIFVLRWTDLLSGFSESITFVALDFFAKGLFGVLIVGSREVIEGHHSCEALVAMALMGLKPDEEGHIVRRASMVIPSMAAVDAFRATTPKHSYVIQGMDGNYIGKANSDSRAHGHHNAGRQPSAARNNNNGGLGLASPNANAMAQFQHYQSFFANANGGAAKNNGSPQQQPRTPREMVAASNSASNSRHPSMRTVDLGSSSARSYSGRDGRYPQIEVRADDGSDSGTAREDEVAVEENGELGSREGGDIEEAMPSRYNKNSRQQQQQTNRFSFNTTTNDHHQDDSEDNEQLPSTSTNANANANSANPMMDPTHMAAMMTMMQSMMAGSSNRLNNIASPLPVSRASVGIGNVVGSPKYPAPVQSPGSTTASSTRNLLKGSNGNGGRAVTEL